MKYIFKKREEYINLLDPQAVEANRVGLLTQWQQERIESITNRSGCITLLFGALIIAMSCGFFTSFQENAQRNDPLYLLVVAVTFAIIFLFLGLNLRASLKKRARIKKDRQNYTILQAEGLLIFEKNGYYFQTNDHRYLFLPPIRHTGGLLPGKTYRVYYLKESGLLLSAEEIAPFITHQARTHMLLILAKSNKFTLDDLKSNRNGKITPSQRIKLLPRVVLGLLIGIVNLIFGSLLLGFYLHGLINTSDFVPIMFLFSIPGILTIFILPSAINGLIDIKFSKLEKTQGIGRKQRRGLFAPNYYYIINNKRFNVRYQAYQALIEGIEYRAYYLPRTKTLLSIEPVVEND